MELSSKLKADMKSNNYFSCQYKKKLSISKSVAYEKTPNGFCNLNTNRLYAFAPRCDLTRDYQFSIGCLRVSESVLH